MKRTPPGVLSFDLEQPLSYLRAARDRALPHFRCETTEETPPPTGLQRSPFTCTTANASWMNSFPGSIQSRSIPPFISRLTGIDDSMVAEAPRFRSGEGYRENDGRRGGGCPQCPIRLFLYPGEYRSLGFTFSRDYLCTVRLSRKLLPGHRSYSTGNLCERLGITIENRHRAAGDASPPSGSSKCSSRMTGTATSSNRSRTTFELQKVSCPTSTAVCWTNCRNLLIPILTMKTVLILYVGEE